MNQLTNRKQMAIRKENKKQVKCNYKKDNRRGSNYWNNEQKGDDKP